MILKTPKQWLIHLFTYGTGVVLLNAFSFLLIPIYTGHIPPSEYGILELLNRTSDVIGVVIASGLGTAALAFYQFESADPKRQNSVFSTALVSLTAAGLTLNLVTQPICGKLAYLLFKNAQLSWAVRIVLATAALEVIFQTGLTFFQAKVQSRKYVWLTVARFITGVSLTILLVVVFDLGLLGILVSNLIHTGLFAVASFVIVTRGVGFRVDRRIWWGLFSFGLPFVPGGVFMFVLNNGDRYFLQMYRNSAEVGLYSLGYRLASAGIFLVLTPFLKVWGSVMISVFNEKGGREKIARIGTYLSLCYLTVALAIAVLSPQLIAIVSPRSYFGAQTIMPVVALAYWFWAISSLSDTALYTLRKTYLKPIIMGTAAGISVVCYALLIPRYGGVGAAVATLISFAAFAVITFIVAHRLANLTFEFSRLGKLIFVVSVICILGRRINHGGILGGLAGVAALTLLPVALFLIGFVTSDEKQKLREIFARVITRERDQEVLVED